MENLVAAHLDLIAASEIDETISSGTTWSFAGDGPEISKTLRDVNERLSAWIRRREELDASAPAWDDAVELLLATPADPVLQAIRRLADDARALAQDYAWFLTRPIELPDGALDDPRFLAAVGDLQDGGQGLGTFAGLFARKTKQALQAVRLRAVAPASAEDWKAVARFIGAVERAKTFCASWNHACAGTGLPAITSVGPAAGRDAVRVLDRFDVLSSHQSEAIRLTTDLRRLFPQWPGVIARKQDASPIASCLHLHIDRARLIEAEATRRNLLATLAAHETPIHGDIRLFAAQLRTEPAAGEDPLCPGDWQRRWRLRRLASWLDASQQLDQFRGLHQDRQRVEGDLAQAYTRLIEQRTWLALKQQASPVVMAALSAYAVAVGKIGRGTGKSANRHRKTARRAANAVKGALPCWIMPHHRVSESLPPELGIFDLVIVDEASQSTLAGLPALFRAQQILVVGDDKQVSPDHVGLDMAKANERAARHLSLIHI